MMTDKYFYLDTINTWVKIRLYSDRVNDISLSLITLVTKGSFAARFREMSGTAKGRQTGRRPATSGEAASEPLTKSALIYRA